MEQQKKPLTVGRKLLILLIVAAVLIGGAYLAYYLLHYTFYNAYEQYLQTPVFEEGTELQLGKEKLTGYKDYKLAAQTDTLKLYLNTKTSDVAVEDLRTGKIFFAIPQGADEDPIANKVNKQYLKSHLIVTYFNSSRTEGTYDSYSMSVERDQVTYEAIEGGIRVTYLMGDFSKNVVTVPLYLTQEKYDEIIPTLSEKDALQFSKWYTDNSDVSGMKMLLKAVPKNKKNVAALQAMLETAGFTDEDLQEQMALAGSAISVPMSMSIPVEYRLEGDHLSVTVPVSGIEEKGGASVYRIQLLRNFAAADTSMEGSLVVPNGDGSLIYFNNGKTTAAQYTQYIYGLDPLAADYTMLEYTNKSSMALFGICREDGTVLATIEDGASLAAVTAGVSGKTNSYNNVYATFVVRGSETLEMFGTTGNEASLPIVEPAPYNSDLTVRYTFLPAEQGGYNGIAAYMRQRLIDEGVLKPDTESGDIRFFCDIISGVEMRKFFLGKQYRGITAMTTFDEAGEISNALAQAGIHGQIMNLQGWFNDGVYHDAADRISVLWKAGGKSGLEKLNDTVAVNGGVLSVETRLQKVAFGSRRYNARAESSKYYGSGYVAEFGQVSPVSLRQTASLGYSETLYDLVSPKFLVRYATSFAEKIMRYDVAGISLQDLGGELHSDKKRTGQIDREQALNVVMAMLQRFDETGRYIVMNEANDYAWGAADAVMNLPLNDNDYALVDVNIPLYEMIIHGSLDYCGTAYNLLSSADARTPVLTMIEYGAAPHFVFTERSTTEMKYSGMNGSYATTFDTWKDTAQAVYSEVNAALGNVTGAFMTEHTIVDADVRAVTYSNGTTIYVNYGSSDRNIDGITVPAGGYAVG